MEEVLRQQDSERALARVLYVTGDKEAAFSLLREGRHDIHLPVPLLIAFQHDAQAADFKLKEGDLKGAVLWAEEAGLSTDAPITSQRVQAYYVYVRILMAQERYNDARMLLDNLERLPEKGSGMNLFLARGAPSIT